MRKATVNASTMQKNKQER